MNAIVRVLAPTPDSQDEPLLESNTAPGKEQAAETVDQDEGKCLTCLFALGNVSDSDFRQGEETEKND